MTNDLLAGKRPRRLVRFEQEQNLVVLKREILGDRAFLLPGKNIVENAIAGERTMTVCNLRRLLAETRIVVGHERRKERIRRRDRRNAREPQFLDQTVLQRAESPLHTALGLAGIGADDVDIERMQRPTKLGHAIAA